MAFKIVGRSIRSDEQVSVETLVCFRCVCHVVGTKAELKVALMVSGQFDADLHLGVCLVSAHNHTISVAAAVFVSTRLRKRTKSSKNAIDKH